jgi:hypothetical protein
MGLHLGWISNEPGLRPRDYDQATPREPQPDPVKVAALQAAQHARGLWGMLLIVTGLFALLLFGAVAYLAHVKWAWAAAAGLALACWLPVVLLSRKRRRAAARLAAETKRQEAAHAAELATYEQGKAQWAEAEAERIATAPRWLQVAAHEDISRLDVFGGTPSGRGNLLTGLGWELLAQHAVIVLDLSQDRVAEGLLAAADQAGIAWQHYELPGDLAATPLLSGLDAGQIASLIVEVVHADDAGATAAGRATDLMILKKITGVLGDDVSMARLHAAIGVLLADSRPATENPATENPATENPAGEDLDPAERAALAALFGDGLRRQLTGNLVKLAAVIEPLAGLGSYLPDYEPARLTCLSLADGPRDVTADLTASLIVQWVTRVVAAAGGFHPAIVVAGGDEQSTRHLGRLTALCERLDIPLIRTFSRLTEESARHLDTRHTAFMRLATRPEALRAAEHIGLERRFVAGKFSHRHSVSRSRTRTSSESVTHSTGSTQGESVTHTTGTTTGQAYSEAEVPRHDQNINIRLEDHRSAPQGEGGNGQRGRGGFGGGRGQGPEDRDGRDKRDGRDGGREDRGGSRRPDSGRGDQAVKDGKVSRDSAERVRSGTGTSSRDTGGRVSDGMRPSRSAASLWGGGSAGKNGDKNNGGGSGNGGKPRKPQIDLIKTRTWYTAQHESEAKTQSWTKTEETSHTRSNSRSRTDGVSVGDEISYELVYDHKVAPETLMALPEDQMLAPHIVEAAAGPGKSAADSKMVALVVDPAVVASEAVAPVRPHEIPAYEPPAPAVSSQVPDYERVPRPALES